MFRAGQIDMVEPELLQRSIEGAADRVRRQILVPDLCGDVQIGAGHFRGRQGRADRLLIGVHFSGVEVAVAQIKRALDRRAAGIALHAEGAEPELGQADALSFDSFHGDS
jgi:hypothetical protein